MRPAASDDATDFERITTIAAMVQSDFFSAGHSSRERFNDELPHAAQVIAQTALRYHAGYTEYAITGAGIAAKLELGDTTF